MSEPALERCPVCDRGHIERNQCTRCRVIVPCGIVNYWKPDPRFEFKRRPDQDKVGAMTDYVRTKADRE